MLRTLIERERPVAIGEIGLDFYIEGAQRERQQALFEAQLALAEEYRLPVLLHVRKAHDQVLQTLKCYRLVGERQPATGRAVPGTVGFGGMLTHERSSKIRKLACELPLEAIVLETDAPDMAVATHHGERNSPEYLPQVAHSLAGLRGQTVEEVAAVTTATACALFGLGDRRCPVIL